MKSKLANIGSGPGQTPFNPGEVASMTKDIADETKAGMKELDKDKRYKFLVQCILGANIGQGVRVGSR